MVIVYSGWFSAVQYLQLCLFTFPFKTKVDSIDKRTVVDKTFLSSKAIILFPILHLAIWIVLRQFLDVLHFISVHFIQFFCTLQNGFLNILSKYLSHFHQQSVVFKLMVLHDLMPYTVCKFWKLFSANEAVNWDIFL